MLARRLRALGCGALALGTLALLAACGPTTPGSSPGTAPGGAIVSTSACDAASQWQPPNNNVQLDDFALTGPSEGWAVGVLAGIPLQPGYQGPTGVIYHLVGGQWQQLPQTYPGEELTSIAMDSPTDGWIVASGTRMLPLHYDGTAWRTVDVPAIDAAFGPPGDVSVPGFGQGKVQMFGPGAGWYFAATDNPSNPNDPNSRTTAVAIIRYQHGAWTAIPAPNMPDSVTLFDFAADSADDAWLLGEDYGSTLTSTLTTLLYHYANGQWSQQPLSFDGSSGQHLWMLSPTNGWTVVGGDVSPAILLHFDGSTWSPVDLTQATHLVGIVQYMYAIGESAPGTTWFGALGTPATSQITTLLAYGGGQWQHVPWPYPQQVPSVVVMTGNGDLWGVGDINHLEGCAPAHVTGIEQGVFYHYTQGQWAETILP